MRIAFLNSTAPFMSLKEAYLGVGVVIFLILLPFLEFLVKTT